ncbi:16S rRNA (guanine527-N7)-methyltransferase [Candidatus Magnetomorum sp. HK-1]|nr:16S rRNA (guanine527-N7)-methyltransferase [Candidatus Magnetomorum sp. HK-1]
MVDLLKQESLKMGISLTDSQANKFLQYANTLKQWNQKVNLTRITSDQDIVIKHFLDSMAVSQVLSNHAKGSFLDVGSGAGFPGIPLGLILPDAKITLLDASRKRINFLKYIINILGLKHINAHHGRIENLGLDTDDKFDIVVSRAFSEMKRFVHLSRSLIKTSGRIVAMKGKNVHDELKEFQLPDDMHLTISEYNLPILDQKRYLICFKLYSRLFQSE